MRNICSKLDLDEMFVNKKNMSTQCQTEVAANMAKYVNVSV